jgi:hypothetical protein
MQQQNKPNDQIINSRHQDSVTKKEMGEQDPIHDSNLDEANPSTAQRGKQPLQTGTERLHNK